MPFGDHDLEIVDEGVLQVKQNTRRLWDIGSHLTLKTVTQDEPHVYETVLVEVLSGKQVGQLILAAGGPLIPYPLGNVQALFGSLDLHQPHDPGF